MTQLAAIDRGTGLGEVAALFRTQPHNIEAEQAVPGAILVNNEAFHRVAEFQTRPSRSWMASATWRRWPASRRDK